jgi:hypothetical protein
MKRISTVLVGVVVLAAMTVTAFAATTVVVTPTHTQGWSTADTRPGGTVNFQNPAQGPVVPTVWQQWDVDAGLFWSTRSVTCSNGAVVGTPGGPASYTLSDIRTMCPNAVVIGFGVQYRYVQSRL